MRETSMHIPTRRPACWTTARTERGQVVEGWPEGVKPGMRNPFWDQGRTCGQAMTAELWATCLFHTPTCAGCARGWQEGEPS